MDRVFIEELTVFAQIGVYDWEQQIKQKLVFDLEMAWDCKQAAETDDVAYCLLSEWLMKWRIYLSHVINFKD